MTSPPESKPEVTSCQYFEALYKTNTALVLFDSLVLGLPVLRSDSDLLQKVEKARNDLWELYQSISAKQEAVMKSEETKP